MNNQTKIALLWLMLVVCSVLHYNYPVSDHFCGIANNIDPLEAETLHSQPLFLKIALQLLPLVFALAIVFINTPSIRYVNVGLAGIYTLFHGAHFISQLSQEPLMIVQAALLAVTFGIAISQVLVSWYWVKEPA